MSYATGTATSHTDLLDKLVTFLTTDAALVAAGQNWALEKDDTVAVVDGGETIRRQVYLRGPGLAGDDEIHVQLASFDDAGANIYSLHVQGSVAFNGALDFTLQPGASPATYMPLHGTSMTYRFAANGRRFIVVAKVGGVYESLHAGFMLPNARPSQYPYPLLIGACSGSRDVKTADASEDERAWPDPADGSLQLRWVDGTWLAIANWHAGPSGGQVGLFAQNVWPYNSTVDGHPDDYAMVLRACPDGSYLPERLQLHGDLPYRGVWGEIDGAYFVPGFGITPEMQLTIGSDTFRAIPNRFRTGDADYWLLKES